MTVVRLVVSMKRVVQTMTIHKSELSKCGRASQQNKQRRCTSQLSNLDSHFELMHVEAYRRAKMFLIYWLTQA